MAPQAYNYYQRLQVDPEASQEVIEAAYRRLARLYHPDYNASPKAMAKMQDLNVVYSVLKDPLQRRVYDQKLAAHESTALERRWFGLAITPYNRTIVLSTGAIALCLLTIFSNPSTTRTATDADLAPFQTTQAIRIEQAVIATIEAIPTRPFAAGIVASQPAASSIESLPGENLQNVNSLVQGVVVAPTILPTLRPTLVPTARPTELPTQLPAVVEQEPAISTSAESAALISSVGDEESASTVASSEESPVTPREAASKTVGTLFVGTEKLVGTEKPKSIPVVTATPQASTIKSTNGIEVDAPKLVQEQSVAAAASSLSAGEAASSPAELLPVTLLSPVENTEAGGRQIFAWSTSLEVEPGHGFEMVFWKPGEDAMTQGFGLTAPTTASSVQINLDALDDSLGNLFDQGVYLWGVLYVQTEPSYNRIALLSDERLFRFSNFGTNGPKSSQRSRTSQSSSPTSGE